MRIEVQDRSNDRFNGDRPACEAPEKLTVTQRLFRSRRWFWLGTLLLKIQFRIAGLRWIEGG